MVTVNGYHIPFIDAFESMCYYFKNQLKTNFSKMNCNVQNPRKTDYTHLHNISFSNYLQHSVPSSWLSRQARSSCYQIRLRNGSTLSWLGSLGYLDNLSWLLHSGSLRLEMRKKHFNFLIQISEVNERRLCYYTIIELNLL